MLPGNNKKIVDQWLMPDISTVVFFLSLLIYALISYYSFRLFDFDVLLSFTDFIPQDGVTYHVLSQRLDYVLEELDLVGLLRGILNWATIPIILYALEGFFIDGGLIFLVFNSIAVAFGLYRVRQLLGADKPNGWMFIFITLLTQPYIFSYLLVPNKDLIAFYFLAEISFRLHKKDNVGAGFFASIAMLFKLQFAAAFFFYFVFKRFKGNLVLLLFVLSMVYPIYTKLGLSADLEEFFSQAPEVVSSAQLMTVLESIAVYPLGMMIVGPIRFLLNVFAGLTFARFSVATSFIDYVSAITGITLGLVVLAYLVRFAGNHWKIYHQLGEKYAFVICYAFAMTMVPFLQTRYYWLLIPFVVCYFVDSMHVTRK